MATKKPTNFSGLVSIVIPAYKQEKTIQEDLLNLISIMDKSSYKYEIICVIDGQLDNTQKVAERVAKKHRNVKVEGYLVNLGKGHAVRYGMARAKGDIVGFIDSGLDLNKSGVILLLEHMKWYNAQIIIGSKRHPVSKVAYPWQRRIISFVYQMVVKVLFNLNIRDTQVGMKFFKREVLEAVLPRVLVKQFAFDIELLSVSKYLGFDQIYEAPIELQMEFKSSSTVTKGFVKTVFNMLWDTAAVFYRLRILKYYDTTNKKKWITPEYLTLTKK